jgi:succinate dehydrogenase / fumarate reductase cytochrome b subunit
MKILRRLLHSSLGKKYIMAVTGLGLFLFVIGHMVGNLQVFLGPEAINAYGHFLQSTPELLWPARVGMLTLVGLHVWSAARLARENRAARPAAYSGAYSPVAASYASRTMLMSGLILASFIVYHLLHFTAQTQAINLTGKNFAALTDAKGHHDVFAMIITGFRQPVVAGFYILAMGLLSLHLSHGVGALFQSLGLKSRAWSPCIDRFGRVIAWIIFLGYISIPVAVQMGYGKELVR